MVNLNDQHMILWTTCEVVVIKQIQCQQSSLSLQSLLAIENYTGTLSCNVEKQIHPIKVSDLKHIYGNLPVMGQLISEQP